MRVGLRLRVRGTSGMLGSVGGGVGRGVGRGVLAAKVRGRSVGGGTRLSDLLVHVDVHLDEDDVGVLFRQLLEDRRDALARAAPGQD